MKRAAVIENWAIIRVGVEATLRRTGIATATSTSTASEFLGLVDAGREAIDLVVIGYIADMTQLVAVREVSRRAQLAGAGVVVLTSSISANAVMELCADGAHAVVARDSADIDLSAAVDAATQSRRYVAPELLNAMFATKALEPVRPGFDLTVREREVLAELAAGRTNAEISQRLMIGTETVKTHLNNVYGKLGVRRRAHAVSLALAAGLV